MAAHDMEFVEHFENPYDEGSSTSDSRPTNRIWALRNVKREIIDYARYLGMELPRDAQFLWIAEKGLAADLPEGWAEHEDVEGKPYFHDCATGETVWTHPRDKEFWELYHAERELREEEEEADRELDRMRPRTGQSRKPYAPQPHQTKGGNTARATTSAEIRVPGMLEPRPPVQGRAVTARGPRNGPTVVSKHMNGGAPRRAMTER